MLAPRLNLFAPLVAALLAGANAGAALTTFDGALCENAPDPVRVCGNGLSINQSVGDVAGQLDVVYTNRIASGNAPKFPTNLSGIRWFDAGYGDLKGVLWARGANGVAEIALLPAARFKVRLDGFDLGAFSNDVTTQYTIYDGAYSLLATSGALSLDAFGTNGRTHSHFDFDLSSVNGIIIQWGADSSNVALDNLNFLVEVLDNGGGGGGTVPEPASLALLAAGMLGVVTTRGRRNPSRNG